ncbi:MAG: hypothetical protein Q7W29_12070 [bacterium]|nr:hypothetical protein [bacterium]
MPKATPAARSRARMSEAQLRQKAQRLSGLALETLAAIMGGEGQDSVRLAAAREVLDRGHGRPKLGAGEVESEGLTVLVQRFTDADPNLEAKA